MIDSPPIQAVVFDIGKVLIQWDMRCLLRKLYPSEAQAEWAFANVVTETWHFQHDCGRDLAEMVQAGEFREDLFYRLNVVMLTLPPLRERKSDIRRLAEIFLKEACEEHSLGDKSWGAAAMRQLEAHSWPGNVRELKNLIERTAILSEEGVIESIDDLAPALDAGASDFIAKPYDATEVLLRVRNLLSLRSLHARLKDENLSLEARVKERTDALAASRIEVLERLAMATEARDDLTGEHTRRVGGEVSLKEFANGDCTFFDGEKRCCTIYPVRPRQCRTWPFWNSNLESPEDWESIKEGCPGVGKGAFVPLEEIEIRASVIDI